MKTIKFKVHLPYECLFDLRWGFIRKYSGLSDIDLFPRFTPYCARLTDNLTHFVPSLTKSFKVDPEVVALSPRTAILTVVTNIYRQFAAERPDHNVSLHITLDFASVPFIPNERRRALVDTLTESMGGNGFGIYATYVCTGYEGYTTKQLRKNFNALVVYDIDGFINHYNAKKPNAYAGIGIVTRPLFVDGKTPEAFHHLISKTDKRNPFSGQELDKGDHYEILSDAFSHLAPVYFHEPQYFSAILPK